eukprot:TRINITY_DN7334_c0_g1_i3.p1 TRINITY_DN7334_c0_g1~~TRINITY_DN7334_c0_g1_i3.p1  ORF type:complete len:181 (+),score=15.46 TRINITY_DN7334_c0_g1_i3:149-691(+)
MREILAAYLCLVYSIPARASSKKYPAVESAIAEFRKAFPQTSMCVATFKEGEPAVSCEDVECRDVEELSGYINEFKDCVRGRQIAAFGKCIECTVEKDVRVNYAAQELKRIEKLDIYSQTKRKSVSNKYSSYFTVKQPVTQSIYSENMNKMKLKVKVADMNCVNPIDSVRHSVLDVSVWE